MSTKIHISLQKVIYIERARRNPLSEHFSYVAKKGFASSPLEETQVVCEIVQFCEKSSLDDPCQGKPLFAVVFQAPFLKNVLCFHSVNAIPPRGTFWRKTSKTNLFLMPHVFKTCSPEGSQNAPRGAKVLMMLFYVISLHHGPQNDPKTKTKH